MRLRFFGGLTVERSTGEAIVVPGRGQQALLYRLAIDTGTTVTYRTLGEDVWPDDAPADPRAALQSLVSRLRRTLGSSLVESTPGGYRLALSRDHVDVTAFQDLVTAARSAGDTARADTLARQAIDLWVGDPWTPGGEFDWMVRDLLEDRAHAERLRAAAHATAPASTPDTPDAPVAKSAVDSVAVVPAPLTPLVGRRTELALIADQLAAERLVTILGPGGAGKTTLALETARHGVNAIVVELAPATRGEVWAAIAGAVGRSIRLTDATSTAAVTVGGARERALEALAGRSVLLVLDNCEHVSDEAAAIALELLREMPAARILATSREPLGVPGEAFVALGPLPQSDGVELFARRVRAARGTAPAASESAAIQRIVARLDALPLALELAAARARTLSIPEIDSGLDDRFALLAAGPRAADPRHQTLRALIDWSWETLTEPERVALLAVAVFPDGFAAADAELIAEAFRTDAAAFDLLVDRSLLRRVNGRFRMLETVREYGLDRLRTRGDEAAARVTQARAMAELSAAADGLLRGPRVREALAWFDVNDENLATALRTCAADPVLDDTGVLLTRSCLWMWMMRERFDELRDAMEQFGSSHGDSEAAAVVGTVKLMFSTFATSRDLGDDAHDHTRASFGGFPGEAARLIALARAHPSELSAAVAPLLGAASAAIDQLSADTANVVTAVWTSGLTISAESDDELPDWTVALLRMLRAAMAQNSGDVATLGVESEQALALFRSLGDIWGIAFASQLRSEWLLLQGRLEEALAVADASTENLVGLTAVNDLIQQRTLGISVLMRLGRFDEARRRLAEIEELARRDGSDRVLMQAVFTKATIAIAEDDGDAALRSLDALPPPTGTPDQFSAWFGAARAQALVLADRTDEAREVLREALPMAVRSGDQPIVSEVVLAVAAWLAATGRDADALRAVAASIVARGAADHANPVLARLVAKLGDPADAVPAEMTELEALLS